MSERTPTEPDPLFADDADHSGMVWSGIHL